MHFSKPALLALAAAIAIGGFTARRHARSNEHRTSPSSPIPIHVPHTNEALVLDGELTEASWDSSPLHRFRDAKGRDARPYSYVRFLWSSDGLLHVGLYASDLNIVSAGAGPDGPLWKGDSFHLVFANDGTEHSFDIGPTSSGAVLTDGERRAGKPWDYTWSSGAHVALDMDEGTVDRRQAKDEEWVLEMSVPLASLGLKPSAGQQIDFRAHRCDIDVRGGPPLESPCPAIDLALVLDP
jgi:hypothetical protein